MASGELKASYVFCRDRHDPWFSKLHRRAVPVFHADWISDSISWNIALPVKSYLLNGCRDNSAKALSSEDSQATVCVPEDSNSLAQDEQEPPSSQTLAGFPEGSTCTAAAATATKRKSSPEADVDMQPSGRPRKIVRISDFSCGAEAVPASTPQAKRSKQKARRVQGTPYLDLRKMVSSKRANEPNLDYEALDASGARKIATASAELRRAMESSGDDSPRTSVCLALDILRDIPVENAVRFKPGQLHDGKEFRCRFVSQEFVTKVKK
ncbi:hypothetical protein FOMPIDRAFT_1055155 [Fomitopsis schrenkii]|uniref:BRCT domain-containing protein n=1 Tax=Fomitopsis schrenkii TaxID=2126942 RepID=S8DSY0_FOMSC|nr:hypothetical protein FOMPIDRAFT_1055155 [Fomitopsis schrenkii]